MERKEDGSNVLSSGFCQLKDGQLHFAQVEGG